MTYREFLEKWYTSVLKQVPLSPDMKAELDEFYQAITFNERLHNLAVNPLLLTVMTALHRYERLPDKRVQVYEKCSDLLLDTWARLRYDRVKSELICKLGSLVDPAYQAE